MWVAKNKSGIVHLYWDKPKRYKDYWIGDKLSERNIGELFRELRWEDEPIEISLIVKNIDEEKLDELAEEFYSNVEQKALKNGQVDDWGEAYIFSYNVTDAYKAGFYKAKEG